MTGSGGNRVNAGKRDESGKVNLYPDWKKNYSLYTVFRVERSR
jgi:hypothetical protein